MDLRLFKDLKYLNISLGVSLSFTSDINFGVLIPLILGLSGFTTNEIAFSLMVYFGTDFVTRIFISVVTAIFTVRNRYMFLGGSFISFVFRIGKCLAYTET